MNEILFCNFNQLVNENTIFLNKILENILKHEILSLDNVFVKYILDCLLDAVDLLTWLCFEYVIIC